MLGRVQTCLTLLSLNRSLDKRLQLLGIGGGGENGAVAVDEVHGTARVVGSVLAPYTVLVVQFQQTRLGVAITFHGLLHSIGLLLASDGNDRASGKAQTATCRSSHSCLHV